jgi:hypothetical protein
MILVRWAARSSRLSGRKRRLRMWVGMRRFRFGLKGTMWLVSIGLGWLG